MLKKFITTLTCHTLVTEVDSPEHL